MNYKLVIFDLDGTLVDSLEDIGDAMNRVLEKHSYPTHNYDSYRFFVGNGIRNLVIQSLPETARDCDIVDRCFDEMIADYEENYMVKTHLYDGISQMLDALRENDIKLAILSNKADAITQKVYENLLSKWSFNVVIGARDDFPRKPDPSSALYISQKVGVSPNEVCYVGDTVVDMQTARSATFTPVGAAWGFRSKMELIRSGAMYIINSPMDLLPLLEAC